MCINIALSRLWPARNNYQRLAGTGVFYTRPKNVSAAYDDPDYSLFRLHYEFQHRYRDSTLPLCFKFLSFPSNILLHNYTDADIEAFNKAINEEGPISRGFWKSVETQTLSYCPETLPYATSGRWAAVAEFLVERYQLETEYLTLGGWWKDGYGCYLKYTMPVGHPIELDGQFEKGPSGLIYQVGKLAVKIPMGTRYALTIRCSDTGAHSGFVISELEWSPDGKIVYVEPRMVSLFAAPHEFPARGYFFDPEPISVPDVPDSLDGAVQLAEQIAANDGFPRPDQKVSSQHIYDALAAKHMTENFGPFGV